MTSAKPTTFGTPSKPTGRPRVGPPINVSVTDEQRAWLETKVAAGNSVASVVRSLIQAAMDAEQAEGL